MKRTDFWYCNVCNAQNSVIDGDCQFCECQGSVCERDSCADERHFVPGDATPEGVPPPKVLGATVTWDDIRTISSDGP